LTGPISPALAAKMWERICKRKSQKASRALRAKRLTLDRKWSRADKESRLNQDTIAVSEACNYCSQFDCECDWLFELFDNRWEDELATERALFAQYTSVSDSDNSDSGCDWASDSDSDSCVSWPGYDKEPCYFTEYFAWRRQTHTMI
jgi:hypothetical protein